MSPADRQTTLADGPHLTPTSRSRQRHDNIGGYEDLEPMFEELAALDAQDPRSRQLRIDLISRCLPLAAHIARRFAGRGEPLDDLTQVARMGLVRAVDRFDPSRESRFLSFAVPTVMGEVRRYFRDNTWTLRVPRPVKDLHMRIAPAVQTLTQRNGRAPTPTEIATELQVEAADVCQALIAAHAYQPTSIDIPNGSDNTIADTVGAVEARYDQIDECMAVQPLIAQLPLRERQILIMRFFESMTQSQIAEKIGVSQMQVSRILATTLKRLRNQLDHADDAG